MVNNKDINFQKPIFKYIVGFVIAMSLLPLCLTLFGFDFSTPLPALQTLTQDTHNLTSDSVFQYLVGAFWHTILEWSVVVIALLTVVLTLIHFKLTGDLTAPIIGIALLCSGIMDGYQTLVADRLIIGMTDSQNFIPFSWAASRTFNSLLMMLGVGILLHKNIDKYKSNFGFISFIGFLLGSVSVALIFLLSFSDKLPDTTFLDSFVARPWDLIPLFSYYILGAYIYPRLHKKSQSIFSFTLLVSLIPYVVVEMHMAFGSRDIFDSHFNMAHFVKIIAYLVPFIGLLLDYIHTYQTAQKTQQVLASKNTELFILNQDLETAKTKAEILASRDCLTNLFNRNEFFRNLEISLQRAVRADKQVGLLFIDLDDFKEVNDTLGHRVGDALLVNISNTLVRMTRKVDSVARLGGDEFAIILDGLTGPQDAGLVAESIIEVLSMPQNCDGKIVTVHASIGISISDGHCDPKDIIQKADMAMYASKKDGKGQYCFYDNVKHAS